MGKFLTGKNLEESIYDIIWKAEKTLLIVSPYIKLNNYFRKLFEKHKDSHNLHIIIVFGKNEDEISKSLNENDFSYFKEFPKISIIYAPNLHAKYYGNERNGLITSINFHNYSIENNIEFGVFYEQKLLNNFIKTADNDAWEECTKLAHSNEVIFIKRPVFKEKNILGLISTGKDYVKSEVLVDNTSRFFRGVRKKESKTLGEFPLELSSENLYQQRPSKEEFKEEKTKENYRQQNRKYSNTGYCIRTGQPIPFNPLQPMCYEAWRVWNEFQNWDYPENFCHRTGQPSYGRTSMRNPIL